MVKLVDMPDLGSGAARRVGSSPITRTKKSFSNREAFSISTQMAHENSHYIEYNKFTGYGFCKTGCIIFLQICLFLRKQTLN